MKLVAVTQRAATVTSYGERRDCLDQAWTRFLAKCGICPLLLPNEAVVAVSLCANLPIDGVLLTGGNDLVAYGGDAPERDAAENALIDFAVNADLPILGVCRGMQMIQHHFGIGLAHVPNHVARHQTIMIEGTQVTVNSYHNFGARETLPPLETWAVATDGVVKAVRHPTRRLAGIMWHPERLDPFEERDMTFFSQFFGTH